MKKSHIYIYIYVERDKHKSIKYWEELLWDNIIFFQKALHGVSRSFRTIIRCRLIQNQFQYICIYIDIYIDICWDLSWCCQFGIVASKLPSCSVSSLTNFSSSCRKGFRPFSSKVFAKPLSCLHFGHVFVNAAWPLQY